MVYGEGRLTAAALVSSSLCNDYLRPIYYSLPIYWWSWIRNQKSSLYSLRGSVVCIYVYVITNKNVTYHLCIDLSWHEYLFTDLRKDHLYQFNQKHRSTKQPIPTLYQNKIINARCFLTCFINSVDKIIHTTWIKMSRINKTLTIPPHLAIWRLK